MGNRIFEIGADNRSRIVQLGKPSLAKTLTRRQGGHEPYSLAAAARNSGEMGNRIFEIGADNRRRIVQLGKPSLAKTLTRRQGGHGA
jgi:hypothetical protein